MQKLKKYIMKRYVKKDEYCGNSYEIQVKRHNTEDGTMYVVKLTSYLLLEHDWMKKVTFDYSEICDKLVVELTENFKSYVDGLNISFDETMIQNKFNSSHSGQ